MSISNEIVRMNNELPSTVKLVAVSKFKPSNAIAEAYEVGQRAFAESRPQELAQKAATLPEDIEWHFIGHLQTNKIKQVLPVVSLIQSVDSEHLLSAISREALLCNRVVDCLLEVHIAHEESKQGFSFNEARDILSRLDSFPGVNIIGLMGMASFVDDQEQIRKEFHSLKIFFDEYPFLKELSMGMSGDYLIAIDEGATMVRIGTTIFGSR